MLPASKQDCQLRDTRHKMSGRFPTLSSFCFGTECCVDLRYFARLATSNTLEAAWPVARDGVIRTQTVRAEPKAKMLVDVGEQQGECRPCAWPRSMWGTLTAATAAAQYGARSRILFDTIRVTSHEWRVANCTTLASSHKLRNERRIVNHTNHESSVNPTAPKIPFTINCELW